MKKGGAVVLSVFDVAAYILNKLNQTTHMKLQKLVYYSQAWSLVWDEKPLFKESIQAWANGPVVPELFAALKGTFTVTPTQLKEGSADSLNKKQRETVDRVLDFYSKHDAQWLSDLTHMEAPWRDARQGLPPGDRSTKPITHDAMAEYYGSLEP